jgi:pimeloyl-ACP methyl ester carboxylesterase
VSAALPAKPALTKPAPWTFAAPWGARGYVSDLDGPVHWIEFGEEGAPGRNGMPIVFVHGLGGSHLNWCLIGPELAAGRRAVALDLHGFGLTPGTRATATVQRNTRLLDRFVREVTGGPVILAGNSMGGLISIMQASAAPDTVRGLVLIDPALPPPRRAPDRQVGGQFLMYALPGIGELYVRSRNPGWETVILPGVGHTPQLEVPDAVTGRLADWLHRHF